MPILPAQAHFRSHVVRYRSLLCLGTMLLSCRLAMAEKPSTVLLGPQWSLVGRDNLGGRQGSWRRRARADPDGAPGGV